MLLQAALGAERVDDLFDAVVDAAQRLELLLPVDPVGVLVVERQVFGFADEARLVGDVALVEAFGAVVRQPRALEPVVLARRRLGPGGAAEVAVRGRVVELQVEGLFGRRVDEFFGRQLGQLVGLVVAGQAVERRERAAGVVADSVFAGFPAAGVAVGAVDLAVVVERVAVVDSGWSRRPRPCARSSSRAALPSGRCRALRRSR